MEKISLRKYLINEIMREGYIPIERAYAIGASLFNAKQSNVEWRLRESESPFIERVFDDKNRYIVGYRYKIEPKKLSTGETSILLENRLL